MPRIKGSKNKAKNLTIDEQITQATARVEELKKELESAEAELNTLTTLRDEAAMKELAAAIAASGKSFADVIAWIKNDGAGDAVENTTVDDAEDEAVDSAETGAATGADDATTADDTASTAE